MKKNYLIVFLFLINFSWSLIGQTILNSNICGEIIKTTNHSCSYAYTYWGRDFELSQFNIDQDEEFIITEGQFALSYTSSPVYLSFNIYAIDNNFPASFDQATLLGSSQEILAPYVPDYLPIELFTINFDNPVIVPAGTQRILVEVQKGAPLWGSGLAHIAGTALDTGISWQRDCVTNYDYENADSHVGYNEINNYYINVTGTKRSTTIPFTMNISNNCSDFFKGFMLNNNSEIASVIWDFGDPDTGANNTSTEFNPKHDFSIDATYTITATITAKTGKIYTLQETIDVREPPEAYSLPNLEACEDSFNSGIASTFDTSLIEQQILRGRTNIDITYWDGAGNELPNPLPNPLTNNALNVETIAVRVSYSNEPCCYSETTFDLIVNPLPDISSINDIVVCDMDADGYALFDLSSLQANILNSGNNLAVEFFHEDGSPINQTIPSLVSNKVPNQEIITILATNTNTGCSQESTFKLIVSPQPSAYSLPELYGCDENNDGISEYFDTSNIESAVLGNQTGMQISYFDNAGNLLPNPLPNPYTNNIPVEETITVRVTNPSSSCYAETALKLKTSNNPQVNSSASFYACDQGNGYANFDTSAWDSTLVGNQTGLDIFYYDKEGNKLPTPLPPYYENTETWSEILYVRVENQLNPACYAETTVELVVNQLPQLTLATEYVICNNEPSLTLNAPAGFESYLWEFKNNTIFNIENAELKDEGVYTLTVTQLKNGIVCEKSIDITLARSVPPVITSVDFDQLGNNYIKINAEGDGDFEYSIDGINFQGNNYFYGISGGEYIAYVRDREGCGNDLKHVTLIDYPKFFTPNGDGFNDYWQIEGISTYTDAKIMIFNRYGKLIKQLNSSSLGWSGNFNGSVLPSDDYWFSVDLKNGTIFKGHFTLKH